ncbi:MAG: SBBP repeat-containing protein [Candidatus Sulfotelmatobacter sp.]
MINPGRRVGCELGSYDPKRAFVIDPAIAYSAYLGGSAEDLAFAIAADGSGNAYVTGEAQRSLA